MKNKRRIMGLFLAFLMLISVFAACSDVFSKSSGNTQNTAEVTQGTVTDTNTAQVTQADTKKASATTTDKGSDVREDGKYTSKDQVAAYLIKFGRLPSNYITKKDAQALGWVASKGNLWKVTDKMSIGGDKFGNLEGKLPAKKGRQYYECDIDYKGGTRGAKRIIYSNDGLIYYTDDHYNTFQKLH